MKERKATAKVASEPTSEEDPETGRLEKEKYLAHFESLPQKAREEILSKIRKDPR